METISERKDNSKIKEKRKDYFITLNLIQIAVCAVIVGLVAITIKNNSTQLLDKLNNILNISLTKEEISDTAGQLKEVLFSPAGLWIGMQGKDKTDETTVSDESTLQQETLASDESTTENEESTTAAKEAAAKEKKETTDVSKEKETTTEKDEKSIDTESSEATGGESITDGDEAKQASLSVYSLTAKPVAPIIGSITSPFGYREHPKTGETAFHTGIDIAAATGTNIKAAFYGKVTKTGYNAIRGNYVIMTHSDTLQTRYYHLSEITAEEGAVLRQGETVGLVGSTGWSTGPHLHFEIRLNNIAVNPMIVFDEEYV